jgi:hypothetical protein
LGAKHREARHREVKQRDRIIHKPDGSVESVKKRGTTIRAPASRIQRFGRFFLVILVVGLSIFFLGPRQNVFPKIHFFIWGIIFTVLGFVGLATIGVYVLSGILRYRITK